MSDNPLENYFRTKEIYIKLPTDGRYFTEPVKFNMDGELGIMPMNTKDESLLKIPDTLFSGESMYTIVKSIAPDITNPYEITVPDLDVILLATRSVTYGGTMNMEGTCPHCGNTELYDIDLKQLLGMIKPIPTDVQLEIQGLTIKLKPNTVKVMTAMGISQIQSQQLAMQMAKKSESELEEKDVNLDEYRKLFEDSLNTIAAADIAIIADTIESVTLPDGQVITNLEHIIQWLSNSNSNIFDKLREYGKEQNNNGLPSTLKFTCSNEDCSKTFENLLNLNPTFFFINK